MSSTTAGHANLTSSPLLSNMPNSERSAAADVISIHVPRNTQVLDPERFSQIRPGAVPINTSLGPAFEVASFLQWIARGENFAILDAVEKNFCAIRPSSCPTKSLDGPSKPVRDSQQVLENSRSHLADAPVSKRNPRRASAGETR